MTTRQQRGEVIAKMGGQIRRIDGHHYQVSSQSRPDKIYNIHHTERGWTCDCPDHQFRGGICCKHIHAVEVSQSMREAVAKVITIKQMDLGQCKFCESKNITKDGTRKRKRGEVQQFKCHNCSKRFIQNLGFEKKQASPEQITMAVNLVFSGLSTRKAATTLKMTGGDMSHMTVMRWAEEYGKMMEAFADQITPQVGEKWRTDELYLKIRGECKYLFAMLDSETRFWLAKMVAEHKGTDDVRPMFKQAKKVAGKIPHQLVSDGAANFGEAHRDEYAPKNFLWKDSQHIRHIHMAGDMNNNQQEAFNGATVRHREKVIRGFKRDDSAILSGLRVYHNFVRPHLGLPDGLTPGEAAGIQIEGDNKILTMIQAATLTEIVNNGSRRLGGHAR